jgi:hypothetical protein
VLEQNPSRWIARVSYEAETALPWGRDIKRDIERAGRDDLPISIRTDGSRQAMGDATGGQREGSTSGRDTGFSGCSTRMGIPLRKRVSQEVDRIADLPLFRRSVIDPGASA